jgi:hypothetical protein
MRRIKDDVKIERERQALILRDLGFTYREIGKHLGFTGAYAHQIVRDAIVSDEIRGATKQDLAVIREWLRGEWLRNLKMEGFFCN